MNGIIMKAVSFAISACDGHVGYAFNPFALPNGKLSILQSLAENKKKDGPVFGKDLNRRISIEVLNCIICCRTVVRFIPILPLYGETKGKPQLSVSFTKLFFVFLSIVQIGPAFFSETHRQRD